VLRAARHIGPWMIELPPPFEQGNVRGKRARKRREELRRVVGFSAADEIEKLDRLKKSGSISDQEFARLRAKLVQ
jgi:hypothetical protein